MRVDVVSFPGMRLAGLRHDGPYEQISNTFATLFSKAAGLGPPHIPDAHWVAVYDAAPGSAGDQLRSFATVSVDEDADIGDLEEVRIAPGTYAMTVHTGSRSGLTTAWKVFTRRLADSGHHALGGRPSFEIYANQEEGTAEQDLRTELYVPIR